jgi:uncharacterized membrane protein
MQLSTADLVLFMIYSYGGATLEHLNYYFGGTQPKALANPIITGFPIYGMGAYMLIWLNDMLDKHQIHNCLIKFFLFATILTIFEYCVGLIVGAGSKSYVNGMVASWDYSKQPFNLNGIVSLKHFVVWGILGLILIQVHPYLKQKVLFGINS